MKRFAALLIAVLLAVAITPVAAMAQNESPLSELSVGHWLEVRGRYLPGSGFEADSADLVQPASEQVLVGTAQAGANANELRLFGFRVQIDARTRIQLDGPDSPVGVRVKVDGRFRGKATIQARSIRSRGPGRDRLMGRIDRIDEENGGLKLQIMGMEVLMNAVREVEHEERFNRYAVSEGGVEDALDRNRDEEDRFGSGVRIGEYWSLAGQGQARGTSERNFNLRSRDPQDVDEMLGAFRARLEYRPDGAFFAVAEINHRQLWTREEQDSRNHDDVTRLGEAFLYWQDPFGIGLDVQAGRVDFDDDREWLFDQNLDTLRGIWRGQKMRVEYAYSETLSDGSIEDEAAVNHFLYLSNHSRKRHVAAWIMHRDFDLPAPVRSTHVGFRMLGDWLEDHESWLDIAWLDGRTGDAQQRGLALDLGTTWQPGKYFAWTLGYAWGQGDSSGSGTGRTYRQSGMQDNNGKFAGVTSFRYYGEAVDPELSNLSILTAGIGWLPTRKFSLDLVWHDYRQDALSTRLTDTRIDRRPNGISKDIGSGLDLVLGWRAGRNLDIEAVAGWFKPGRAFVNVNRAFIGKLQFRFRF